MGMGMGMGMEQQQQHPYQYLVSAPLMRSSDERCELTFFYLETPSRRRTSTPVRVLRPPCLPAKHPLLLPAAKAQQRRQHRLEERPRAACRTSSIWLGGTRSTRRARLTTLSAFSSFSLNFFSLSCDRSPLRREVGSRVVASVEEENRSLMPFDSLLALAGITPLTRNTLPTRKLPNNSSSSTNLRRRRRLPRPLLRARRLPLLRPVMRPLRLLLRMSSSKVVRVDMALYRLRRDCEPPTA